MEIFESFILGLIQGLTEFLPVSSSGHLALAQAVLGFDASSGITFEVVVHFGTLCSILIYYRKEIGQLLYSLRLITKPAEAIADRDFKMCLFILLSMIPAFVAYKLFKDLIEAYFQQPKIVASMLVVTGTLLFITKFRNGGDRTVGFRESIIMGIAQAFAMMPGISRSGSTIATGLYSGLKKEEAANFSFLMVIPVIGGATLLEVLDLVETGGADANMTGLIVGFITSFVSGYFALKYLIDLIRRQGIHYFAYYCWAIGLGTIAYLSLA